MSNFSKKGKRVAQRAAGKERMKEVRSILADLDVVAHKLIASGDKITEDNLAEQAELYTGRELGDLEISILLSKLKNFQDELEAKRIQLQ